MTTDRRLLRAYALGKKAALENLDADTNPYDALPLPEAATLSSQWRQGFEDAVFIEDSTEQT